MPTHAVCARTVAGSIQMETLSGAKVVIDASRSTITESGGAISQVNDLMGSNHFTQSTAGKKPTKGTDGTVGLTKIGFDGGDVLEAADGTDLDVTNNFTIYIAFNLTSIAAFGYMLSKALAGSTGYYIQTNSPGTLLKAGVDGNEATIVSGTITGRHVLAVTYDSALGSNNLKTWWDGSAGSSASWAGGATNTANTLCLGAARAAADYAITGDIFELFVGNTTHDSTTVTSTCASLKTKWATT